MAKFHKKIQARLLRKNGQTLLEIAAKLDISKSTASNWCNDVVLTSVVKLQMQKRTKNRSLRSQLAGAATNRNRRLERVTQAESWAKQQVASLSRRDLLMTGIGLYWGEGSKDRKISFGNTDPFIVLFIKEWFEKIFGIPSTDFLIRVYINGTHKDRYPKVQKFWQDILKLPHNQFYSPTYTKAKHLKVYENRETYYGVLSLRVRNSTEIQYRILGLIKAVANAGVVQGLERGTHKA